MKLAHRLVRLVVACLFAFAVVLASRSASAYPWMIRHGYTQCVSCHADPAGGGLLTAFGRAQGEILLRTRYDGAPSHEPGRLGEPMFGAPLPEGLSLGASLRAGLFRVIPSQGDAQSRFILMQADALGQYQLGRFRVNGSIGVVDEGGNAAAITRGPDEKLISRVHWVGVDLGARRDILVRAGRMVVPFGLRSVEHTRFVRSETRTDANAQQQYGLSVDLARGWFRGGAMFIAGNFAISPDKFRSRGFAAYGEAAVSPELTLGVSTMLTHSTFDPALLTPAFRHAHGVFARYSPVRAMVVSGEWDFLHTSQPTPGRTDFGGTGLLSVDVEPIQGLHFGPTGELTARRFDGPASLGAWGSVWWFFLPHLDVRFDAIGQSIASERGRVGVVSGILQLHGYL